MEKFVLKTPDEGTIELYIVYKNLKEQLIQDKETRIIDTQHYLTHDANIYLLKKSYYLLEYTKNNFAILFKHKKDYDTFRLVESYFYISIHLIEESKIYYSFMLRNDKILDFLTKKYIIDEAYTSPLEYKLYRFEGKEYVCYIYHRVKDVYSANWYPNMESFLYYYKNGYAG